MWNGIVIPGGRRLWLISAGFLLLFVLVDHAGALRPWYGFHQISPWNPVVGLSFSLIYLLGVEFWPLVLVSHVAGYLVLDQTLGIEMHGMEGALLGALPYIAAGHWYRTRMTVEALSDVSSMWQFVVLGVAAATAAGFLHAMAIYFGNFVNLESVPAAAYRRFVGDLSGFLGVGAAFLLIGKWHELLRKPWLVVLQFSTIVATLMVVFAYPYAPALQLFYLLFLPLLWVALVHGVGGAVAALVVIQLGIVLAYSLPVEERAGLTAIQTLMIALTITGLLVGMLVTEWRQVARRQREQQAAMERALRLRSVGEVAAVIGHEISQPLTAISTYGKLVRDAMAAGEPERAKVILDKLIAQSARAGAVIHSFRNLLRRGEVNREKVCFRSLSKELRDIVGEECKTKNITLDVRIPADFPEVPVDRVQLQQALLNLVRNSMEAIEHTGKRGEIVLAAKMGEPGRFEVTVSDDGPGFHGGFNEVAATPFLSTKADGTGLGLAVARAVAEAHGGSLAFLEARKGAAVRLRLPVKGD